MMNGQLGQPEESQNVSASAQGSSGFAIGLALGLLVGAALGAAVGSGFTFLSQPGRGSHDWDLNSDGVPDSWARYDANGSLIETTDDRNHDRVRARDLATMTTFGVRSVDLLDRRSLGEGG